jgi:L-ribulose-5-phosphate 3-epimerase
MQRFRFGAATDVFAPAVEDAASIMHGLGMRCAELRQINGRTILEADNEELARSLDALGHNHIEVVAIASPILKCSLDEWPQHAHMAERAFEIATLAGAQIVRVFSGLREAEHDKAFERAVDILQDLSDKAARHGLIIGLENDRACNIATAQEMGGILAAIDHTNLQVVWDPASAYISGEKPFPTGYQRLDPTRIALVHAKDCTLEGHKPVWAALGEGDIDWQGQIDALADDHYKGAIDLETYWPGIHECVRNLKRMVESLAL